MAVWARPRLVISLPVTFLIGRRARQNPDLRYATDFDVLVAPTSHLSRGSSH